MKAVSINKNMQVSGSGASAFRNMAVWEGGYNVCLDVCRAADQFGDQSNVITQQVKSASLATLLSLSKGASFKPGKQYVKCLKDAFVSTKQMATVLMLCHDLNYIQTERFLELNSKLNEFSSKLWKFIRYSQRKVRKKKTR